MMRKVLLITNIFPPQIGGPATFIDNAARSLSENGWKVTVVCSSDKPTEGTDDSRPFTVRRVDLSSRYLYEIRIRLVLLREMLRHRIVFVNGLEPYVSDVNRVTGRSYLLKVVGDTVWETARNRGETLLDIDRFQQSGEEQARWAGAVEKRNRCVLRAKRIIVPSAYLKRMVAGWGVEPERITIVANGVDREFFNTGPLPQKSAGGPLKVVFAGRLTNWKGVETLLLALHRLRGVLAVVAGDGPEYPHLVELSRQLGLDRDSKVHFMGRLDSEETRHQLKTADLLVLTSLYEGLSHTILEGFACGLPCIASACGGNVELVTEGKNGFLIPPQDVDALASVMLRLRDDRRLLSRLAEGARESAAGYPLSGTIEKIAAVIEGDPTP